MRDRQESVRTLADVGTLVIRREVRHTLLDFATASLVPAPLERERVRAASVERRQPRTRRDGLERRLRSSPAVNVYSKYQLIVCHFYGKKLQAWRRSVICGVRGDLSFATFEAICHFLSSRWKELMYQLYPLKGIYSTSK